MSSLNILLIHREGKTKDFTVRVLLYLLFLIRVSKINNTLERVLAGLDKKEPSPCSMGGKDGLVETGEQSVHTERDMDQLFSPGSGQKLAG